jgi:putative transposase
MNEMDIYPIYPKMSLSKRMQQARVCPYLLRNAVIDASNQAWFVDITCIPIRRGFLYLTAVIDWYGRCIVAGKLMITGYKNGYIAVAKSQIILGSGLSVYKSAVH